MCWGEARCSRICFDNIAWHSHFEDWSRLTPSSDRNLGCVVPCDTSVKNSLVKVGRIRVDGIHVHVIEQDLEL
jgi:hypothetical protein